ncbi:hypothetical protein L6452_00218 [Arctium lappa]|uniref:Uncharacterized protein n=1 Tax=Arctium lappa TaxID=4217 RepID=A0ACB9FCU6_ARCLA|nr:hypothetical protein L6452_00218 [Arctium lappa]
MFIFFLILDYIISNCLPLKESCWLRKCACNKQMGSEGPIAKNKRGKAHLYIGRRTVSHHIRFSSMRTI